MTYSYTLEQVCTIHNKTVSSVCLRAKLTTDGKMQQKCNELPNAASKCLRSTCGKWMKMSFPIN